MSRGRVRVGAWCEGVCGWREGVRWAWVEGVGRVWVGYEWCVCGTYHKKKVICLLLFLDVMSDYKQRIP